MNLRLVIDEEGNACVLTDSGDVLEDVRRVTFTAGTNPEDESDEGILMVEMAMPVNFEKKAPKSRRIQTL